MKKIMFFLLCICLTDSVFSQNPISIDRVINDLDWENCSESDVILAFKDNVVKRDKEETWDDGIVSSFILKNVKIEEYTADANIIVSKYNRKLLKIGGITIRKNLDWNKDVDTISQRFEDYFSTFWGKEYKKTIEYDTDYNDSNIKYKNINCEWNRTYHNDKTSKGSFFIFHRAKCIVIAIEPK